MKGKYTKGEGERGQTKTTEDDGDRERKTSMRKIEEREEREGK